MCGISGAALGAGGLLLIGTISIPTGVLAYNHYINEQNKANNDLCTALQELDKDQLLFEDYFEGFITIIKSNQQLLLEVENSLNGNQRELFEKILHPQEN